MALSLTARERPVGVTHHPALRSPDFPPTHVSGKPHDVFPERLGDRRDPLVSQLSSYGSMPFQTIKTLGNPYSFSSNLGKRKIDRKRQPRFPILCRSSILE